MGTIGIKLIITNPQKNTNINNYLKECPTKLFDKSTIIFESVQICATPKVSEKKLTHASNVIAQWLDNNQDGIADNQIINDKLKENKAILIMTETEPSNKQANKIYSELEKLNYFGQDLYAIETNNPNQRDATQEETHHLITGAGWAKAYSEIFNDKSKNSKIFKIWQISDKKKFYNYNDPTCDSECKTMEHLYKTLAAYLNSSADLQDEEFSIKTNKKLKEKLPEIIKIFESKNYNYPTQIWPNGKYNHTKNIKYLKIK